MFTGEGNSFATVLFKYTLLQCLLIDFFPFQCMYHDRNDSLTVTEFQTAM